MMHNRPLSLFSLLARHSKLIPQSTTRAMTTTSFYDSQSGTFITLKNTLQIYDITLLSLPANCSKDKVYSKLVDGGFDGITSSEDGVVIRELSRWSFGVKPVYTFDVSFNDKKLSQMNALASIAKLKESKAESRVVLIDAFGSSSSPSLDTLQLYSAELADAGVTTLSLDTSLHSSSSYSSTPKDEERLKDDLEESISTICEIDVTGIPMRNRIGLRTTHPTLLKPAIERGVWKFDTCALGLKSVLPSTFFEHVKGLDELPEDNLKEREVLLKIEDYVMVMSGGKEEVVAVNSSKKVRVKQ